MNKPVPYDIELIVNLLQLQHPEEIEVAMNIELCQEGYWKSKAYIHFVAPIKPNQPGSKWQFDRNIILEDESEGTIVIDVLMGNEIGGIEFVNRIGR